MEFASIKEYRVLVESSDTEHSIEFEEIEGTEPVPYPIDWLNREGIHPARAKRIRMPDSSMAPLIPKGDVVLVNTADIAIQSGKIYAFGFMNDFLIKRIFKDRDGALILHSDNPAHEPRDEFMAYQSVFDHLCVIGRVHDEKPI
nr:S24 family peptidase [uncultured Rhodoferax sp.]